MRECCRQSQAEVVSNSSNRIHQTWGPPFSRALHLSLSLVTSVNSPQAREGRKIQFEFSNLDVKSSDAQCGQDYLMVLTETDCSHRVTHQDG